MKSFLVILIVGLICTSAWSTPISVFDFVIFSHGTLIIDGGFETEIGGHTLVNGNIGSNQDLFMQGNPLPGYPAQLNGSAYAGRNLTFGQDLTVGSSSGPLREVVANGEASIGGDADIYGNLYADVVTLGQLTGIRQVGGSGGNVEYTTSYTPSTAIVEGSVSTPSSKTFSLITMPAPTIFTAGGIDQTIDPVLDQLTLVPGTYGTLSTSQQNQTLSLSSGNYFIDDLTVQGSFTLEVDLTSGDPISIYSVGNLDLTAQNIQLNVKGTGTGGAFVPISDAPDLAALIYFETHGVFDMGGENSWGGTVYASYGDINIGQYINWTGAAYAYDTVDVADHGTWNYVPIPEPTAICLLGIGGLLLRRKRRA